MTMVDVITSGATVIAPTMILGYESSRPTRTLIHDVPGRSDPDATLRPAGLRKGRMTLGFAGPSAESDSASAESVLAGAVAFVLTSPDRASVSMRFVLPDGGALSRVLDPETRDAWMVEFDWQEVAP
ncbi:hypothetical protein [uncultured Microbacterium sp.]|uniref:hypothetical protein n=1 Tax=uncultured Microbacterium sp. TaxID=191216 RepID=UPI0025D128E6|nr:hypothetical protein [uncultured Microbacterium sp.]